LNQYLQTWSKELKANAEDLSERKLLRLVVEFSPQSKRALDFETEFANVNFEGKDYLRKGILGVQKTLYKLFIGPNPPGSAVGSELYLVKLIE